MPNGERIQESTGTANKREAEKILALRISEVQRGVFVKPINVTLSEFGEKYIEYVKPPQALVESGCADARQPANVLRSMQAAGHHTAAD